MTFRSLHQFFDILVPTFDSKVSIFIRWPRSIFRNWRTMYISKKLFWDLNTTKNMKSNCGKIFRPRAAIPSHFEVEIPKLYLFTQFSESMSCFLIIINAHLLRCSPEVNHGRACSATIQLNGQNCPQVLGEVGVRFACFQWQGTDFVLSVKIVDVDSAYPIPSPKINTSAVTSRQLLQSIIWSETPYEKVWITKDQISQKKKNLSVSVGQTRLT